MKTSGFYTKNSAIYDKNSRQLLLRGINWFGLETPNYAPHGLWARNYKDMINQMKTLGFNTIRLPYSNQLFDQSSQVNGIDYSKNPDLKGLSGPQVMDKVVGYATKSGMYVILDRHRPDSGSQSALWYTDKYPESRWIGDWQELAARYKDNPMVIGADLHNEPHDPACWGCGDSRRDWRDAATRAGNAILKVNPKWLIFVEGVQTYQGSNYWWGGNLKGAKQYPVQLDMKNKVVYSVHDYPESVSNQPWFQSGDYPDNLAGVWDSFWGYLVEGNSAPVLVGEFGTRYQDPKDKQWLQKLTDYMSRNNISWTYWSWNPDSGDTGGILKDDWQTVDNEKYNVLKPYLRNNAH